jgi:hypothetical protein
MTAGDHPLHQDAAAPGPAASARFAEGILGKYFVAPALRQGPSLVLRMLRRPARSNPSGRAQGARRVPGRAGETALEPPVGRRPDGARPASLSGQPPSGPHVLVQRKPLVDPGRHGVAAAAAHRAAPLLHGESSPVRHGEAAAAAPGVQAGFTGLSRSVRPGLPGWALPLQEPQLPIAPARTTWALPSRAPVPTAATIAGPTAVASSDIRAVSGGDPGAGLQPARVWARPGIDRLVQRRVRTSDGTHKPAMERVNRPAWAMAAAAAAAHAMVPAASRGLGSTPPAAPGRMTPALAARAAQAAPAAMLPPRESAHRREAGPFVFGPAALTASPPRPLTLQPKALLPVPGIDRGTGLQKRIAASSPVAMARPAAVALHAPVLTSRAAAATATASRTVSIAGGVAPRAAEAGPATAAQAAAAVPTLVAATLGTGTALPAASPSGSPSNPNGSAAATTASMPIQALADRVFSLLERRLVVERERRGIRS